MRKLVLVLAGVVALSVPAASVAGNTPPGPKKLAVQTCKGLHNHHVAAFKLVYHSFADCLKQGKSQAKQDLANARQTCKDERANDLSAFESQYGSNGQAKGKGALKNAFGKCVSQNAKQNAQDNVSATVAAAKECKSERASDPATFKSTYGSNTKAKGQGNGKNAFGKCVSQQAKANHA